jgi:hypothetical protein
MLLLLLLMLLLMLLFGTLHPSFPFDGTNIHVTISKGRQIDGIVQEFRIFPQQAL